MLLHLQPTETQKILCGFYGKVLYFEGFRAELIRFSHQKLKPIFSI